MNRRIKEIAEQAGRWVYATNLVPTPELFYTKFAELLLQDAFSVMKSEGEKFALDLNFDAVKGVGRCSRKVKEHFGVEE